MKKRILSIVICLFLLFGLTACGEGAFTPSQKKFNKKVQSSVPSTDDVIATNNKYTLQYDSATGGVVLIDNATGTAWDVCPKPEGEQELDSMGMPVKRHGFPQSVLQVGYMDTKINGGGNQVITTYDGVVSSGRMVYKPIENGVTIEYYFDLQEFMVPVDYVLCDDYLTISVDSTKIQENDLRITQISIAPFLCSVPNDTTDSYLFVPSGSGALLSSASYSDQGLLYSAYVYGDDLTMEEKYISTYKNAVRLPVYGYKNGAKGGFSIIDNGAETAILNTSCGNTSYKFTTVYPSFQLRGYTTHLATSFNSTRDANIYPENMIEGKFSIRFYPLSNDAANYNGMANVYRDYLVNERGMAKTGEDKAMSLSLIGGTEITKSFLGVPYKTIYATTTLEQANTIISEVSESVDSLAVKFKGYGTSGIDKGKIGGGFTIGDNIGSESQIKKLASSYKDKNVDLYMDYELVEYAASGSGFSYFGDSVMNSGSIKADQFIIDKALRNNEETLRYRLLRPINFADAVSKALNNNSKWKLGGVSLETLTSLSYSDYSNINSTVDYNSKHGFDEAVSGALTKVKENNQKLMANNANDYAALAASIIENAPITSDNGFAFIDSVPFYAMVFKGYIPMTTEPINTAPTPQKAILGAVEGGLGLNYTITSQWDNSLINALYPYFNTTLYSSVKDDMLSTYNSLADYYESIKGAKITSNTIISSGVHSTTFDNGVTVYVNYNNKPAQTPAGEVAALNYIVTGGAA